MKTFIKLIRVKQYAKNFFIFLPLFFSLRIFEWDLLLKAGIAFAGFCLVASSVYILNDYNDRFDDANHPVKKYRPIAAGKVSPHQAIIILIFLLIGGLAIEAVVGVAPLVLTSIYFVMNVVYSMGLKRIAILDVFIIALGFTIRIFVGGNATGVGLQPWIVVMTFLLSLFLALGKRRDDFNLLKRTGIQMRKSMEGYSAKLLDYSMVIMASVIIVSYLMYTLSIDIETKFNTSDLYYTAIFVLLGVLRYMQIIFAEKQPGEPTDILWKDRLLQFSIFGWIVLFGLLIYL